MISRAAVLCGFGLPLCLVMCACGSSDRQEQGESSNSSLDPTRARDGGDDENPGTIVGLAGRSSPATSDGGARPEADAGSSLPSDGGALDAAADAAADAEVLTDAAEPECELDAVRCTAAGRERCDGAAWVSDPCPLDQPACVAGSCVLRGPSMVKVARHYIDSTEVTVAHYVEFLDARGDDRSGQPEACSWNSSFYDGTPVDPEAWPITWVDWCDAWSYCNWAGKRLCGAIEGGAVAAADALDATRSEWFLACGGPNGASHPNSAGDCNSTGGNGGLMAAGSNGDCEGFHPGLFDMEGNAAEWVDGCAADTGASDTCLLLGGSYVDNRSYCSEQFEYSRDTTAAPFGFRCCSG
jgi:hypothetical protein